jgi:hypothetical protein
VRRALLDGGVLGVFGVLAFGAVHAWAIVPIWDRLAHGLPFAVAAGAAIAWAFQAWGSGGLGSGLRFGLLLWLSLGPMTGFAAWLRLSGLHSTSADWELVAECAVAVGSGAAAGWATRRNRRMMLRMAIALLAMTLAMAGPIPVTNSVRAARLYMGFLPIYCGAGVILAALGYRSARTAAACPAALTLE